MLAEIPHSLLVSPRAMYQAHKSVILMVLAQLCSSLLGATAKLLETAGGLAAEQVLFAGMGIMMVLSWVYMGVRRVPEAPLGKRKVWGLLVLRGVAGFVGSKFLQNNWKANLISFSLGILLFPPLPAHLGSHGDQLPLPDACSFCNRRLTTRAFHTNATNSGASLLLWRHSNC
jgi:hypothetical protein